MASKLQLELVADGVNIETLWRALTKDIIETNKKAVPDIIIDSKILEGDEITLGSLLYFTFGPAMIEFAHKYEKRHLQTFLGLEGGYMDLGFTHTLVTFKLDDVGSGNTLLNATVMYDLKEDFDGTQMLDEFLKLLHYYLNSIISYLQKKHED